MRRYNLSPLQLLRPGTACRIKAGLALRGQSPQGAAPLLLLTYCLADRSLAAFMRELLTITREVEPAVEPLLAAKLGPSIWASGLERLLQVRELQASYVYATVLAKKFRVCLYLLRLQWKLVLPLG